ncbi:MAG: hypothetical protein AAGA25_07950 [Planctomycetota bacterium]
MMIPATSKNKKNTARWRRAATRMGAAGVLALGASLWGCQSPEIGDEPVAVELRELPAGVGDAYRNLTSTSLSLAERTAAARTLIEIDDFSADRALASALGRNQPEGVWRAVLQAVATDTSEPPRGLWRPMVAMLYSVDDAILPDVVQAMGRYDDPVLLQRLHDAATSSSLPTRERSRAIAAMGEQRDQATAGVLIDLTRLTEPVGVQGSAYNALASLTAIDSFGEDRQEWGLWWDEARKLDALSWQEQLVDNFARKLAAGRATDQQLAEKLREAERALYQASSAEDQSRVLTYMLGSPLTATKLLALDLAQTRMVRGVAFDEPLRVALRGLLDDESSAEVRWTSAEVLRDLADEPSADIVAQRLIDNEEHVNRVRSAYLQLLARMPRKNVTNTAYDLLEEPGLRSDASAALASISMAQMLTPKRAEAVLQRVRGYLNEGQRPTPSLIRLLGRVGENEDWKMIEGWIDDNDEVIRQAAAQAWANSETRSLAILAERVEDPIIQPIVLRAASERGQDPETLRKLAANPPSQPQVLPVWERALVAMAAQVPRRDALLTAQRLSTDHKDLALVERFLIAAIDQGIPEGPALATYLELRMARAENRLAMGEADLAVIDFEYLLENGLPQMTDPQRDQLYRGLIPAYLQADRIDDAFTAARAFFADPANPAGIDPAATDDPLMGHFISAGHRAADRARIETAKQIGDGLRLLLGPNNDGGIKPELAQQLRLLDEKIQGAGSQ